MLITIIIIINAQLEEKGINIDGKKLSDLRFGNEVAQTTENAKGMVIQLITVNEECLNTDLKEKPNSWKMLAQQATYK